MSNIATVKFVQNPVTGVFGTGNVQWFTTSGTWYVPAGIYACRVRLWGGGGGGSNTGTYYSGGGGGFALKTIYDLSGVTSVSITVGSGAIGTTTTSTPSGGTSSFGSYVSATGGGSNSTNTGGTGIGGDLSLIHISEPTRPY